MSDLQTALVTIGACVVAGVYAFNRWQERQFRRRTELAFERQHDDVLMPAAVAANALSPQAEPEARIEPRLDAGAAPAPAAVPAIPPVTEPATLRANPLREIDSVIDFAVEVELPEPVSAAELMDELNQLASGWDKPV